MTALLTAAVLEVYRRAAMHNPAVFYSAKCRDGNRSILESSIPSRGTPPSIYGIAHVAHSLFKCSSVQVGVEKEGRTLIGPCCCCFVINFSKLGIDWASLPSLLVVSSLVCA